MKLWMLLIGVPFLFLACGESSLSGDSSSSTQTMSSGTSLPAGSSSFAGSSSSGILSSGISSFSSMSSATGLEGTWQSPVPVNWWDDLDQDGVYPFYTLTFDESLPAWSKGRYTLDVQTEKWQEEASRTFGATEFFWEKPEEGIILHSVTALGVPQMVDAGTWKYEIAGDTLKLMDVRAMTGASPTIEGVWNSRFQWWDGTKVQQSQYVESYRADGWMHRNIPGKTSIPAENTPTDLWRPYKIQGDELLLTGIGDQDTPSELQDPDGGYHYLYPVLDETFSYEVRAGLLLTWPSDRLPILLIRQ